MYIAKNIGDFKIGTVVVQVKNATSTPTLEDIKNGIEKGEPVEARVGHVLKFDTNSSNESIIVVLWCDGNQGGIHPNNVLIMS